MKRQDVMNAVTLLILELTKGFCPEFGAFNPDAVAFYRQRLNDVKAGKVGHAPDPQGYFIIGLSPSSHRDATHVLRTFRKALCRNWVTKRDVDNNLRTAKNVDSIKDGTVFAEPKRDSKFGTAQERVIGNVLSGKARAGVSVASIADRLNSVLQSGDSSLAAAQFPILYNEAVAASDLTMQQYMQQLWESLPDVEASVSLADVAKATAVKRNRK